MMFIRLSLTWLYFHRWDDFRSNASICHDTIHFATAVAAVADPAAFHVDEGGVGCRIQ